VNSMLDASYRHCRDVARTRARNFYYSFLLLDKPRRAAMCALYAFNRHCDDLSDEPERFGATDARVALDVWRAELDAALDGRFSKNPIWPAFHDAVERYGIPHEYFHAMIDGVMSDLEPRQVATFDELYRYCYQVASAVGLSVLYVFGFESDDAPPLAEKCGIAFQLTNIIRDVREDSGLGRIYLPAEDLYRFGVTHAQLHSAERTPAFNELMRFEAERARRYYEESAPLVELVNPRSRRSLWALIRIYSRLLDRIEQSGFDVLSRRIRVPTWEKCAILARALAH